MIIFLMKNVYGMSPLSPKSHYLGDSDLIRSVFPEELDKTINSLENFTSTIQGVCSLLTCVKRKLVFCLSTKRYYTKSILTKFRSYYLLLHK